MDETFISLLYPNEQAAASHAVSRPDISEQVCRELGLSSMLSLRSSNVSDYFTSDISVIKYRQAAFDDLLKYKQLSKTLQDVLPILEDICELRRLSSQIGGGSGESYLYSITEIELYVSCIDTLYKGFSSVFEDLGSEAFRNLASFIRTLVESEEYKKLNDGLRKLSERIREVRSITVGVNLDAQLRPCEAGVISINADKFKSGSTLDKILRMSFKNDSMTCIASLVPFGRGQSENRKEALIGAFNSAIEEVFRSSVRGWRAVVGEYVLENTDFLLRILPEIEFLHRSTDLQLKLKEKGYSLAIPKVLDMSQKAFTSKALYNPDVALRINERIVPNDFSFDDNARFYVITGPNRGGKSVHTCAVGLAQCMTQLGMKVCAEYAQVSPVDAIFTHFPQGADDTIDKGRLGEECARLQKIFSSVTENSMVLLDESLSSTGAYEAAYIAADILRGFADVRCRGIFSTHLHDLAAAVPEISEKAVAEGGIAIDTMTAEVGESGERSFAIIRAKPDGKSYACDIAHRYGLGLDQIKELIAHRDESDEQ